jgi:ureidoacrylate peracid hydrolase
MNQDIGKETPQPRGFSRREVLGVIGATAAASLVGFPGEESALGAEERIASGELTSFASKTTSSRVVVIDAKPEPIEIDTARTAVIVVDMQNDFGAKGGMFDRAGIDISMIQGVVDPIARVLEAARSEGVKIVYLKMGFQPDLSDLGPPDSPNRVRHMLLDVGKTIRSPDGAEGQILIRDTWNTDIVPALKPRAEDVVMYKHRFSGFYQTDLDAILKRQGVKYLIVTGCTTSVCVESTAREAMFRDYSCVLLADCMGEPIGNDLPRSNHDASLLVFQTLFGWVSGSEEFIRALEMPPVAAGQEEG